MGVEKMTLEIAFNFAIGLVVFFGGIWVKRIQDDNEKLQQKVERIERDYQRRSESERDFNTLKEFLRDIKVHVERIDVKLDKKADK